jgi:DNA-binding NtrC family response regulator
MAFLIDEQSKQNWRLEKGAFLVGSGDHCSVHIEGAEAEVFSLLIQEKSVLLESLGKKAVRINDKRVDVARLQDGDNISYGENSWRYSLHVALEDEKEKEIGTDWQKAFSIFLDSVQSLLSSADSHQVLKGVLESACRVMQADQGVLVLHREQAEDVQIDWPQSLENYSQSAIQEALRKGEVICWNQQEGDFDVSQSIVRNKISSILASPLVENSVLEKASGYLYVQRQHTDKPFAEEERLFFGRFVDFCSALNENSGFIRSLQERIAGLEEVRKESGIIYQCEAMSEVMATASRVAPVQVPVLITGPTGSGKEEMARHIHNSSPLAEKAFLAVNCGAIPESLMESTLFGHKKGAFTGAVEDRKGIFEEVQGGTLFLDEIGELPLQVQVKLLRVLQEKKVTPVGGHEEIAVHFRLLSATHVDLEEAISEKAFREDLYFRLNVMQLRLPGLQERGRDVLLLAKHFLEKYSAEYGFSGYQFSNKAEKAMLAYSWPGNIRELANRVQKALIYAVDRIIQPEHMELAEAGAGAAVRMSLKEARADAERKVVEQALKDSNANLTLASSMLGVDRKVLRELMLKLNIDKADFK